MYQCYFCGQGFSVGWRLEITVGNKLKIVYVCHDCKEGEKWLSKKQDVLNAIVTEN